MTGSDDLFAVSRGSSSGRTLEGLLGFIGLASFDVDRPGFLTRNLGWFPKPPRFKQDSACDRRAFQRRVEKRRKKKGYK